MTTLHLSFLTSTLITLSFAGVAAASDKHSNLDIQKVLEQVERSFDAFRMIPQLNVEFEMTYEIVAGAPQFAFDRLQVTSMETAGKRRLHFIGFADGNVLVDREFAWNGTKATSKELVSNQSVGDFTITSRRDNGLQHYNYYLGFLRYPDERTPPLPYAGFTTSTSDYLPGILRRNLDLLRVTWSDEIVGHSNTIRVEVPGLVVFWFDPDKGYSLCRQDQLFPKSKNRVSSTIYSNHESLRNYHFPRKIVHEEFAVFESHVPGIDEPGLEPGALRSRKTLTVNRLDDKPAEAKEYVITAPDGFRVHDLISRQSYVKAAKVEDRFVESAKKLRDSQSSRSTNRTLRFAFIALLPVVSILAIYRYIRGFAQ
jgi:hypothetical protein